MPSLLHITIIQMFHMLAIILYLLFQSYCQQFQVLMKIKLKKEKLIYNQSKYGINIELFHNFINHSPDVLHTHHHNQNVPEKQEVTTFYHQLFQQIFKQRTISVLNMAK